MWLVKAEEWRDSLVLLDGVCAGGENQLPGLGLTGKKAATKWAVAAHGR